MTFLLVDQAVARAVHGFQSLPSAIRRGQQEKVVFVILIVPADLPQVDIENIGRNHLLKSSFLVLTLHQADQAIVNMRTVGQEESRPSRILALPEE